MSCLIVLDDGRACALAPWTFTELLNAIAEQLDAHDDGQQSAQWLRDQARLPLEGERGYVDVRELTPGNRRHFRMAIERLAHKFSFQQPATGIVAALPGWVLRLRRL